MFKFLAEEDDDVSNAVTKFAHDYVTMLKQSAPLSEEQKNNARTLLVIIIKKMKYDETYNFSMRLVVGLFVCVCILYNFFHEVSCRTFVCVSHFQIDLNTLSLTTIKMLLTDSNKAI